MALLHLLLRIVGPKRLVVAHLDHGWRESSREDAALVRATAQQAGVTFHGRRLNEAAHSGLEAMGRWARQRFFDDVARCERATAVAVAHHADDQAETVLMSLLRGSGLDGLSGMAVETLLITDMRVRLLRPLLDFRRSDIEAYCAEQNIAFVTDPTNAETRFLRNRVRHEILPLLTTANPGIVSHLATLAALVQDDTVLLNQLMLRAWDSCVEETGAGWTRLRLTAWRSQARAIQRRLLRHAVLDLVAPPADLSFSAVEAARLGVEQGRFGARYDLTKEVSLVVESETVLLRRQGATVPLDLPLLPLAEGQRDAPLQVVLTVPGAVALMGAWRITAEFVEFVDMDTMMQNENDMAAFLAPQFAALTVRNREQGERIQPLGMNGRSRSLKKLMMEQHIPADVRHRWPVVACHKHAVWLPGMTLDHRARLRGTEARVVRLVVERVKQSNQIDL